MGPTAQIGVLILGASLAIGCSGSPRIEEDRADADPGDINRSGATVVTETGCLTSSGDQFVLSSLDTGEQPTTELYQLLGSEDELRPHVGREVRVTGEAEPARIAEMRDTSVAPPVGTSGSSAEGQAQVQTESQVRFETRQLQVRGVTVTGDDCATESR